MKARGAASPAPLRRRLRRLRALAAALSMMVVGCTAVVLNMPAASAATVDTSAWYVLVNRNSGQALDVYDRATANGARIAQWPRNDGYWQQWQFVDSGGGYYRLKSRHSGKVLDVYEWSTANLAPVVQWTDLNGANQQWRLADTSGGHVQLINRHSGRVLEVRNASTANGADVVQYDNWGGDNQQWQLVRVGGGSGGSGTTPPSWPSASGSQGVSSSISVSGTFDGGMRRYYGTGALGGSSQDEGQDPLFKLAAGATLQNVILGSPAADGIHCAGACTLRNVWWEDVGEDAATFRGSGSPAFLVDGGGARLAADKVFQHNGAGTLTVRNFQFQNIGTAYRSCGNCSTQYTRHVVFQNVWVTTPANRLAGINTNYGDTATFSGVTVINDPNRKLTVCQKYIGNDDGDEPRTNGSGADGTYCRYSSSNITYVN
ncbi:Ricin-type beta-trefoil lectin domain [Frankia sp. EI5c]|uniref:pectate lyase n=1 Tax=Frankia sp. EI5c TaxID=683316 RepID=UPI0007C3ECCA|nr:pectate lyase [Frankia sp. EI5c]OAA20028.1 Ricin-type beta-trefoil lectin domain [Frankia sp. EI5c]